MITDSRIKAKKFSPESIESILYFGMFLVEKAQGQFSLELIPFLQRLEKLYISKETYSQLAPVLKRSLLIKARNGCSNHTETSRILCLLAKIKKQQGDNIEAAKAMEQALLVIGNPEKHSIMRILKLYNELVSCYIEQSMFQDAIKVARRYMRATSDYFGVNHFETAKSYSCYGSLLHQVGHEKAAKSFLLAALDIYQQSTLTNISIVADLMDLLVDVYQQLGFPNKALDFLYQSRSLRTQITTTQ